MMWIRIQSIGDENLTAILTQAHNNGAVCIRSPHRSATGYHRQVWKIVRRRRRFRQPFQCARIPWVVSRRCPRGETSERISNKDDSAQKNDERADGGREIRSVPSE